MYANIIFSKYYTGVRSSMYYRMKSSTCDENYPRTRSPCLKGREREGPSLDSKASLPPALLQHSLFTSHSTVSMKITECVINVFE